MAYRKLAKKYHPDANRSPGGGGGKGGDVDTTREFQAINRAYELLFDVEGRKRYDSTLVARENRRSGGAYNNNGGNGSSQYASTVDFVYGSSRSPNAGVVPPPSNVGRPVRPFHRSSTDQFRKPHFSPPSPNTPDYYKTVIENFNRQTPPPPNPPRRAYDARTTTTAPVRTYTNDDNNVINAARMRAKMYDPVNDFIKTKPAATVPAPPPPTKDEKANNAVADASRANTSRHPFQSTSTDQFKRPHVTPQSKNAPDYYRSVIENFNNNNGGRRSPGVGFAKRASSSTSTSTSTRKPITPITPVKGRKHTTTTSTTRRKAPIPPIPLPTRKMYGVGHVFESAQSFGPRDRANDARRPIDDAVAETRPYSQRPTPSYSQTPPRVPADAATPRPPTPSYTSTSRPADRPAAPPISESAAATASSSPSVSPDECDLRRWDEKLEVARSISPRTLLRVLGWPLLRDPPGDDDPEFPVLAVRVCTIALAALSTRHLHLLCGNSPVLAASAITLLVSTCLDRRLGRVAMCGSLAGMSGGHLTPDLSAAIALAGLTSACYEVVIKTGNACRGVGGRLGATAFLATSALANYQGVRFVGRKLRRGLWKSGAGPSTILMSMILYHVLGAVITIFLRESSDDDSVAADPVRASSVVGLLGSLFLTDPTAILSLYGGSFVGMSLPSRLMHGNIASAGKDATSVIRPQTPLSLFGSFAGAGAMAGLFHALTIRHGYWNGGWGGKAGLCAFAGCWAYRGFGNAVDFLRNKKRNEAESPLPMAKQIMGSFMFKNS
ncbi:hypothetical protein ACHAXA_003061 [Cyclostephanos tholiformis]|uniref:J domain-containing protein n=1 Tax=Cyclostephanos tholiformis TaxID=382380 RepID=A0ABD3RB94_9STRA